jgi:hypothetical protein
MQRGAAVHTDPIATLQVGVQAAGGQVPSPDRKAADCAEEAQTPVRLDQEQTAGREGETFRSTGRGGKQDQTAGEKDPGESFQTPCTHSTTIFHFFLVCGYFIPLLYSNLKIVIKPVVIKTTHLSIITAHLTSFNTAHIYSIVKKGNLKSR